MVEKVDSPSLSLTNIPLGGIIRISMASRDSTDAYPKLPTV